MRASEFSTLDQKSNIIEMFEKFLPLAMKIIGLNSLPQMVFVDSIKHDHQPTFGSYSIADKKLRVALVNRHPNDILRTVAHELVHYKQDLDNQLNDISGNTGSDHENEANALAGVVLRHFNQQYPKYLNSVPIKKRP